MPTKLWRRTKLAFLTWPDTAGWRYTLILALPYFAIAMTVGLFSGVMKPSPVEPPLIILQIMLFSIFIPGVMEELLFRGLLHPSKNEEVLRPKLLVIGTTALFILWHPFNYFVFLKNSPFKNADVFLNPGFLTIVLFLGITCSLLFIRTRSIWPCIAVHWLTVVVWKSGFGGLHYFPL